MTEWYLFHGKGECKQELTENEITGLREKIKNIKSPPWRQFGKDEDFVTNNIEQSSEIQTPETVDKIRFNRLIELAKKKEREIKKGQNFRLSESNQAIEVRDAVNAAIYLRRPLLLTGNPGSGKTSLAYAIAYELNLGPVLSWSITARSTWLNNKINVQSLKISNLSESGGYRAIVEIMSRIKGWIGWRFYQQLPITKNHMKRYGNLYAQIVEFENILASAKKAQKGKRFRYNVLEFNYNLESELSKLQQELINKTYQPGEYRTFYIKEPKTRMISAAPYRDRVVHHALCNIIIPLIEPERMLVFEFKAYGKSAQIKAIDDAIRTAQFIRNSCIRLWMDVQGK